MKQNILTHLKDALPDDVVTYQVSIYTVALEAWRRGLRVKFFNSSRGSKYPSQAYRYSISDGKNEYHFATARGSKTTKEAIEVVIYKSKCYEQLRKANVPIPEGDTFSFTEISIDEMIAYGISIGFPLVVKPVDGGGGQGVVTHIKDVNTLKESILFIKNELKKDKVIIEKYFTGFDYRFFVIEDRVIGVTKSYPSYIIGDGKSNIRELCKIMNRKIKANITTRARTIVIDDDLISCLEEQGLSLTSIPKNKERIFVRRHGKHLNLRLNVDCTDEIDPKFKEYAVKALNAIDGLPYGSVDMIINEETNEGVINELNTRGEIMMHIFPMEGAARDVPKAIVDYYFPNTKRKTDSLYFEFKPIKDMFLAGLADEILIPPLPEDTLYEQKIDIRGANLKGFYLNGIYKRAARIRLMGTIELIENKKITMRLVGAKSNLEKYNKYLNKFTTRTAEIKSIDVSDYHIQQDPQIINLKLTEKKTIIETLK
ncbi:hypothetical protein [Amphibacillus indicireducens]|uniref:ATP-grasp domain-containing protein n=1 Tax=Amphibacillus indicireducens TaxID=1076330 RepID=A0ABP7VLW7_9BACI